MPKNDLPEIPSGQMPMIYFDEANDRTFRNVSMVNNVNKWKGNVGWYFVIIWYCQWYVDNRV